ncbi:unnamed protein product [Eruca vesicaria subsp. sativa]|uniref:Uncharacterized protein n=1 Tax=Eruca vesicaria subsp. sativa TaxID=29727 RepID=A0ABC8LK04_ERUVS|nr:unnamed protein product [Eruca vesicaria subsp. sativa]
MKSPTVSSMLLVLFLVLIVFPHMDNALGEQMHARKLKETNHPDPRTSFQKGSGAVGTITRGARAAKKLFGHFARSPPPRKGF